MRLRPGQHTGGLNAFALPTAQFGPEELVQRFLLPLLAEPQRLAGFQVAHHSEKLVVLSPVDLVHSHLFQCRLAASLVPSFEVTQINPAYRGLRQLESTRHLTHCCALAGFTNNLFKPPAERRLRGKLLDLLHPHAAFRTSHPVYFHDHRRPIHAPRQIPDLALPHILNTMQAPTTSAALISSVHRLPPHPQLQCLLLLVHLRPIYPIPRPRQYRRPFPLSHQTSVAKTTISLNPQHLTVFTNSRGEPQDSPLSIAQCFAGIGAGDRPRSVQQTISAL